MNSFEEWYKKHIKQLDPYEPPDRRELAQAAYNTGLEEAVYELINRANLIPIWPDEEESSKEFKLRLREELRNAAAVIRRMREK